MGLESYGAEEIGSKVGGTDSEMIIGSGEVSGDMDSGVVTRLGSVSSIYKDVGGV